MQLDLQLLLPPNRESNWTDLLATLISNDPGPLLELLDLSPGGAIRVRREVMVAWVDGAGKNRSDRLDLLVETASDGAPLVVIEAKVLAPVGRDQLKRYADRFAGAQSYNLLQLSRIEVVPHSPQWGSLTWERVLDAYRGSEHAWVATMAQAWLDQIERLVPAVDSDTVWNDVGELAEGDADLRARGAWLHAQMSTWCQGRVRPDFGPADGGRSWVVSMEAQTADPTYTAYVEVDEGLPVKSWNASQHDQRPRSQRMRGPAVLVTLAKYSDTVNDFDWPTLVRVFRGRIFDETGEPVDDGRVWRQSTAGASKRPGWKRSVKDPSTVPSWLGHGYDMTKHGWRCSAPASISHPT